MAVDDIERPRWWRKGRAPRDGPERHRVSGGAARSVSRACAHTGPFAHHIGFVFLELRRPACLTPTPPTHFFFSLSLSPSSPSPLPPVPTPHQALASHLPGPSVLYLFLAWLTKCALGDARTPLCPPRQVRGGRASERAGRVGNGRERWWQHASWPGPPPTGSASGEGPG